MNNSSEDLIPKEELELSDERVLNDIRRSIKAREASDLLTDIDVRALAVQGVEQYWAERDKVAAGEGRAREPIPVPSQLGAGDDIAMSFRLARRKLADLQDRFIAEHVLVVLPIIAVGLVLLLFPTFPNTNARLFQNDKLAQGVGLSAIVLACIVGFISQWQRGGWIHEWWRGLRYVTGLFAGMLLAGVLVLTVGLQRENAAKVLQQEKVTNQVSDQMLAVARNTIVDRDTVEAGSSENTPEQPRIITFDNKQTVRVTRRVINKDKLVYLAEGEGLPSPIEVSINKNSGELSLMKEDGAKKTTEFFVGNVKAISDNELTLIVKDDKGNESSLSIAINSLVFKPTEGQRVFVAVDSASKTVTDIERVADDTKKTPPEGAKKDVRD